MVIITSVVIIIYTLVENNYIPSRTYIKCNSFVVTTVYSDQRNLKAQRLIKRCDNTDKIKDIVSITNEEKNIRTIVYESDIDALEMVYLIWGEYDGLIISSSAISEEAKRDTRYRVEYLPLRELRVALGQALSDYKYSSHSK